MKKTLIFAAAAALVLASCAKTEVVSVNEAQENIPVGFSNYAPRAITKADGTLVNSGALPAGSKIGVYGYSTGTSNLASGFTTKPEFMVGSVTYASTSATATASDPIRYWPKTVTNLLSFFAYYPYGNAGISGVPTASTAGMGTFTFTQAAAVGSMVDFMISNVANDQYYFKSAPDPENPNGVKAINGVVPLTFNHMLSKVNLQFKTLSDYSANGVTITVTSATISKDVLSKTVLTPAYTAGAAGSLGTTTFTYSSNTKYDADITVPFAASGLELEYATAKLNESGSDKVDFLFVPQVLSDDVKITINYTIKQGDASTDNTVTVQLNQVVDSSSNPITEWHINDFVTYTFVIGLKEITFTASASAWTPITAAGYNIQ